MILKTGNHIFFFFLKAYLKLSPQGSGHYWRESNSCFHIFFIGKWGPTWAPAKVMKILETALYANYQI